MSDAPQQPSLRLKPRLKPADAPASSAEGAPPLPGAEGAPPAAGTPPPPPLAVKLRAATPPPTADLPPPPAPPPAPPVLFSTASTATSEAAPTDTAARLKLKPKEPEAGQAQPGNTAGGDQSAASSLVPETPHKHPEGVPPAFLVDAPPPPPATVPEPPALNVTGGGEPAAHTGPSPRPASLPKAPGAPGVPGVPPFKPKVPHFKPSEKANLQAKTAPRAAAPKQGGPQPHKVVKLVMVAGLLLTFALLLGGGFLAYQHFTSKAEPADAAQAADATTQPSTKPEVTPPPASTTSDQNPAQSTAGKLVQKAQDVVAARRDIEQQRVENVLDGQEPSQQRGFPLAPDKGAPAQGRQPAAEPTAPATYSNLAPGVAVTDADIRGAGKPSPAFRRAVSDFVIRGVFQGTPARAHINGRIVIAGRVVDEELGIVFVGVDVDDNVLIFRDKSGARVMRRY